MVLVVKVLVVVSKFIVSHTHVMFSLWLLFMCGICMSEAIDIWEYITHKN